jgi:hypothetical protein
VDLVAVEIDRGQTGRRRDLPASAGDAVWVTFAGHGSKGNDTISL